MINWSAITVTHCLNRKCILGWEWQVCFSYCQSYWYCWLTSLIAYGYMQLFSLKLAYIVQDSSDVRVSGWHFGARSKWIALRSGSSLSSFNGHLVFVVLPDIRRSAKIGHYQGNNHLTWRRGQLSSDKTWCLYIVIIKEIWISLKTEEKYTSNGTLRQLPVRTHELSIIMYI